MAYGFPMIGNLRGLPQSEINKTNTCIRAMLGQRQKDIDYRKNIDRRLKTLEEERNTLMSKIDELQKKNTESNKLVDIAKTNLEAIQDRYKKEKEKLVAERDETQKKLIQIQSQQTQYLNEIRKKEIELKRIQDRV
jgi:chromatin segregation and condensation protein Rec8/ScpA/Scc1 (kleisin family)